MSRHKGFTLIELAVVISNIALLAILLPASNRARSTAKSVVCQANLPQLVFANMKYAEEHVWIASPWNYMFGIQPIVSGSGTLLGYNWQDWTPLINPTTGKRDDRYGFTTGALYPYLKTHEVFQCPSAPRTYEQVVAANPGGWHPPPGMPGLSQIYGFAPYWSYPCNGMPGYGDFATNGNYSADNPAMQINPDRVQPNPSKVFLYMDQHPGDVSAYDNTVILFNPIYVEGADSLADYHHGGGNMVFFDGHVEYMKRNDWISKVSTSESMTRDFVGAYSLKN